MFFFSIFNTFFTSRKVSFIGGKVVVFVKSKRGGVRFVQRYGAAQDSTVGVLRIT